MSDLVSIIICCYNSIHRIEDTLVHLSKQKLTSSEIEIILVDNNSTDGTSEFAKKIWSNTNSPFQFKIITESKPGLTFAREAGVAAANGEYILFCDDDNSLNANYIQQTLNTFNSDKTNQLAIVGGTGIPKFNSPNQPKWFEKVKGRYAVGCPFENAQYTSNVYGAGMAIKKHVYHEIKKNGFQHQLTDRIGKSLISGGDTEICFAAILLNYKIWWDPNNTFLHEIPDDRLTVDYIKRRFKAEGITQAKLIGLNFLVNNNPIYIIKNKALNDLTHFFKKGLSAIKHNQLFYFQLWCIEKVNFWLTIVSDYKTIKSSYSKSFWFNKSNS